jgi:hypothetical protein
VATTRGSRSQGNRRFDQLWVIEGGINVSDPLSQRHQEGLLDWTKHACR